MSKSSGSNNNKLRVLFADGIVPNARRGAPHVCRRAHRRRRRGVALKGEGGDKGGEKEGDTEGEKGGVGSKDAPRQPPTTQG